MALNFDTLDYIYDFLWKLECSQLLISSVLLLQCSDVLILNVLLLAFPAHFAPGWRGAVQVAGDPSFLSQTYTAGAGDPS